MAWAWASVATRLWSVPRTALRSWSLRLAKEVRNTILSGPGTWGSTVSRNSSAVRWSWVLGAVGRTNPGGTRRIEGPCVLNAGDEADGQRHGKADPRRPHIHDFGELLDLLDGQRRQRRVRLIRDLRGFLLVEIPVVALPQHARDREDAARQQLEPRLQRRGLRLGRAAWSPLPLVQRLERNLARPRLG